MRRPAFYSTFRAAGLVDRFYYFVSWLIILKRRMYKKLIDINKTLICVALCYSLIMLGIVSVPAQTQPSNPNNQSSPQLNVKAQEIKNQIIKIGQNNDITIIGKNGREFYGSVLEIKDESVSINEIDQKAIVEIKYQNIKKVRSGYRSARIASGKRVSRVRSIIPLAVIAGSLLLPIILLANAKD
jgi:hypothetical protein